MNNRIVPPLLALSILTAGLAGISREPASEAGDEAAVLRVARAGLPAFLRDIPAAERRYFGMLKPEDVSKAVPGRPFPVYTVDPGALKAQLPSRSIEGLLKETGEWFVPILVESEWRLLMTVCKMKGVWDAVGVSDALLAAEIGKFQARWPGLAAASAVPADTNPKFVRVFQAAADFMHLGAAGREFLWPFRSGLRALDLPESDLLPAEVAVPLLKAAVAKKD